MGRGKRAWRFVSVVFFLGSVMSAWMARVCTLLFPLCFCMP